MRLVSQVGVRVEGRTATVAPTDHMYFFFAELNLYPFTNVNSGSSTQLSMHKAVSGELFAALQEAAPQYMGNQARQATCDRLCSAIEAFRQLSANDSVITMAEYNVANLTAGNLVGEFPEDKLEVYKSSVGGTLESLNAKTEANEPLSKTEIDSIVSALKSAYSNLRESMVKPTENVWYTITSDDSERSGYQLAADGAETHLYGNGYSYILASRNDAEYDLRSAWVINENADGLFVPQNVSNGGYFGPVTGSGNTTYNGRLISWHSPASIDIIPLGNGQVALMTPEGYHVKANASWNAEGIAWAKANASDLSQDSQFAWTIEEASAHDGEDYTPFSLDAVRKGAVVAIAMPFDIKAIGTYGSSDIQAYELVGKVSGKSDGAVSAYKFKPVANENLKAGTPAVYIIPGKYDHDAADAEAEKDVITFTPVYNTPVATVIDTVNGLAGVQATYVIANAGAGAFCEDSIGEAGAGSRIEAQRGYIIPSLVKDTEDSNDDDVVVVYVIGGEMTVGINSNIVGVSHTVNVYTTDGILLRRHVDAESATNGLARGFYIVGKKKVLVR